MTSGPDGGGSASAIASLGPWVAISMTNIYPITKLVTMTTVIQSCRKSLDRWTPFHIMVFVVAPLIVDPTAYDIERWPKTAALLIAAIYGLTLTRIEQLTWADKLVLSLLVMNMLQLSRTTALGYSSASTIQIILTAGMWFIARSRSMQPPSKNWAVIGCVLVSLFGMMMAMDSSTATLSSTFQFRNHAAHYVAMMVPWLGAWTTGPALLYVILTRCRAAWVAIPCAIVLTRHICHIKITSIVLAVLVILTMQLFSKDISTDHLPARKATILTTLINITHAEGRLVYWHASWQMICDHPLFGVGLGNWPAVYHQYVRHNYSTSIPARPHNDYLWIAAEQGIPAALAYILLIALSIRRSRDPRITASIIVFAVISLVSYPMERPMTAALMWWFMGRVHEQEHNLYRA